ncbi:MAG: hypothetical protein PQJ59_13085 [Spirochaetales bacterium]|nr:hypothetical protein [Spirochaetales bacterium]
MIKRLIVTLFFLSLIPLYSIQWPIVEPELVDGFASPLETGVSHSIGLRGEGRSVVAYDEGELIFWAPEGYGPGAEGSGVAVLEHKDGFRSCYGNLITEKSLDSRSFLREGESLGVVPEGLRFSIRDSDLSCWVNPFFMFSAGEDGESPLVEEVLLEREGKALVLTGNSSVPSGSYRLLVRISDRMEDEGALILPYSVKIRYLGQVHLSLTLDSLTIKDGIPYLGEDLLIKGEGLFTNEGYLDGGDIVINQGKGLLEVEVADYWGNRTTRSYSLNRR